MEQVLELKNIYYAYHTLEGETPALTDISFTMNRGDFIAIVGPSGCGKSTLLSLISGLIKPEQGFIKINGKHLRESTTNVGYMLQHDELFEWRTIYHNVLLGLEVQHMLTAQTRSRAQMCIRDRSSFALKYAEADRLSYSFKSFASRIPRTISSSV